MATTTITFTFRDAESRIATLTISTAAADSRPVADAIKAALARLSNATVRSSFDPPGQTEPGSHGSYASVRDRATLHFLTTRGILYNHALPAPKRAIFQTDGQTLNAQHPDVAALVALLLAHATTSTGLPYAYFIGGAHITWNGRSAQGSGARARARALHS